MNNRIEELYKQSQVGPGLGYDMDKFAELIIQECVATMAVATLENGVDGAIELTLEHFGIEG